LNVESKYPTNTFLSAF